MKKLNLTQFLFLCFILFSCHSKPEKKVEKEYAIDRTINNYKFDDDELAKRKAEADKIDKPVKEKKLQNRRK